MERDECALRTLHGNERCGLFRGLQIWTSSSFNKAWSRILTGLTEALDEIQPNLGLPSHQSDSSTRALGCWAVGQPTNAPAAAEQVSRGWHFAYGRFRSESS